MIGENLLHKMKKNKKKSKQFCKFSEFQVNNGIEQLSDFLDKETPRPPWKGNGISVQERSINIEEFPALKMNKTKTKKNQEVLRPVDKDIGNGVHEVSGSGQNISLTNTVASDCKEEKGEKESQKKDLPLKPSGNSQTKAQIKSKKTNVDGVPSKVEVPAPNKFNSPQTSRNPYKKKRADPTFFNLEDALKVSKSRNKLIRIQMMKKKLNRNIKNRLSGNVLDASNPIRNKGKHREVKRKRVSNLKSLIIKERIIKQIYRENSQISSASEFLAFLNNIDFKSEVERYLKERNLNKKSKNSSISEKESDNLPKLCQNKSDSINETKECNKKVELYVSSALNLRNPKILAKESEIGNTFHEKTLFSSKMREYCENLVTPELNNAVRDLVKGLINLQDRAFLRDPIKAKSKKRHVEGIKEVKKYLTMKKVKLVLIPPDLEKLHMEGSVDDLIKELKTLAKSQDVPCVYAMNRYTLGRCAKKSVPISALAVINFSGLEDRYEEVLKRWEEAKLGFEEKLAKFQGKKVTETDKINEQVTSTLLSACRENILTNQNETKESEEDEKKAKETQKTEKEDAGKKEIMGGNAEHKTEKTENCKAEMVKAEDEKTKGTEKREDEKTKTKTKNIKMSKKKNQKN